MAGTHDSELSLGDDHPLGDLPVGDAGITAWNPWVELTDDTLLFVGQPMMRRWGGVPRMTPGYGIIGRSW